MLFLSSTEKSWSSSCRFSNAEISFLSSRPCPSHFLCTENREKLAEKWLLKWCVCTYSLSKRCVCTYSLFSRSLQLSTELIFTYESRRQYDIVAPLPNVTVDNGTNVTEVTITAVHAGKVTISLKNTSLEFDE